MSYLPNSKWGNCTQCSNKDCACVKRGKDLYCISCARANTTKKQIEKAKEKNKVRMLINSTANKELATEDKISLNDWFANVQRKHSQGGTGCHCSECGSWIPENFIRHATAHLLPKKLFKSVATHELNYLILGAGCGCHVKTDRLDLFVKMNVWPEAARRINIMLPLLPFDELHFISSQLLAELDKIK